MTLLIIYIIGFFLVPVLAVFLDKKFPDSIDLGHGENFIGSMLFLSILWPAALVSVILFMLYYWYDN